MQSKGPLFLIALVFVFSTACGGARRPPVAGGQNQELSHCLQLASQKKYKESIECLEVFKSRYPSGEAASEADLMIADTYYRQHEYLLSAESYQDFIRANPTDPKVDYAYHRSGLAYLKENPKPIDRDQQYIDLAVQNFHTVVEYFPNSPYASVALSEYRKALSRQAKKHFYVGRFYYKYGEYLSAIGRFEEIVAHFPDSGYDEKSFNYLISAYKKTNQKDRAEAALAAFADRFPRSVKKMKGKV